MYENVVPDVKIALVEHKANAQTHFADHTKIETLWEWLDALINRITELETKVQTEYGQIHSYIRKSQMLTKKNVSYRKAIMGYLRTHREENQCLPCTCIDCEFARAVLRHKDDDR